MESCLSCITLTVCIIHLNKHLALENNSVSIAVWSLITLLIKLDGILLSRLKHQIMVFLLIVIFIVAYKIMLIFKLDCYCDRKLPVEIWCLILTCWFAFHKFVFMTKINFFFSVRYFLFSVYAIDVLNCLYCLFDVIKISWKVN